MKRNNVITFRLSDEEFEPFLEAMEILRSDNKSDFFRNLVVSNFDLKKVDKRNTETRRWAKTIEIPQT